MKAQPDPNKKYFAISDVHSYYTAMKEALDEAGYDKDNENHVLILLGDAFDRGDETLEVLDFLRSIPKERRVLIRGNHECLLRDCYRSGFFTDADVHNGTDRTMCHLCGIDPDFQEKLYYGMAFSNTEDFVREYDEKLKEYHTKPFECEKTKELIDWIFSDDWVNYFELGDRIFVHSWVPLETYWKSDFECAEKVGPKWREASQAKWEAAMWGCPWEHFLNGSLPKGKSIVCGHWHVQDFHLHLGHDVDGFKKREIYHNDRLIALDACTALEPHVCNVLVIDGDKCYDKHGNVLK